MGWAAMPGASGLRGWRSRRFRRRFTRPSSFADDPNKVDPLRPAILDGIEAANEQVRGLGTGAATTLVLVEIRERVVRPYHVGDSAILLVGQRGKLKFQTIAHSPIGYAVEAGLIDEKDAIHHEERHMISNVIGSPEMRIEIGPAIEMAARDTLVLASDGLFDNLLPAEIVELVRTGPLDKAVDQLVAVATERMNAERGTPVEAGRSDGDRVPASLILPVALPVVFFDRIYRIGLERRDAGRALAIDRLNGVSVTFCCIFGGFRPEMA